MKFLFPLLLALLGSCQASHEGSHVQQDHSDRAESVQIVFYNFYARKVQFYVGENLLINRELSVSEANESTGLNLTKSVNRFSCEKLRLVSEGIDYRTQICLSKDDKFLYINPLHPPFIEVSSEAELD